MNGFNLDIQYSEKVKGMTLEVWPGNIVRIQAPTGTSEDLIKSAVSKKTKWIIEKQRMIKDVPAWRKREFISGESFPLLGREYRLKVIDGHGEVALKDDRLIVAVAQDEDRDELVKLALIKFYKEQAVGKVLPVVKEYCERLGVIANSVFFKSYEGRWGSCTPKGDLIFNWQIVALPRDLFRYVIAHEVAHLKEMNHGTEFKNLLKKLVSNMPEHETQIKYYQNIF